MQTVKIETAHDGTVTLTFTRPDDTGADKSTSIVFGAVEWAKFCHMITQSNVVTDDTLAP